LAVLAKAPRLADEYHGRSILNKVNPVAKVIAFSVLYSTVAMPDPGVDDKETGQSKEPAFGEQISGISRMLLLATQARDFTVNRGSLRRAHRALQQR